MFLLIGTQVPKPFTIFFFGGRDECFSQYTPNIFRHKNFGQKDTEPILVKDEEKFSVKYEEIVSPYLTKIGKVPIFCPFCPKFL